MGAHELRHADEADRDFLFDVYAQTMRGHVEWAWGWDEAVQRRNLTAALPLRDWRIVSTGARPAGVLHVQERPHTHHIHLLLLLPEFQRRGVGTQLLRDEIERARVQTKGLTLQVIKSNPARRLYDRLGFTVYAEDAVSWQMVIGGGVLSA